MIDFGKKTNKQRMHLIFRGHCMCKEMPVIPVNKVVDPKRIIGKKWRAEEEERHKGSLTQKKRKKNASNEAV
jgi:hypothetical protein